MDTQQSTEPIKQLPFNNLLLNSGFVSGSNKWYMYLSTIAFTILTYLLAPSVTALHLVFAAIKNNVDLESIKNNPDLLFNYELLGVDRNLVLIALFGIFVVTLFGFKFALIRFHHKSLISLMTAYEKFRYPRFFYAFFLWSLVIILTTIIEYFMYPNHFRLDFHFGGFLVSLILMLIFMPVQSGFEEIFFRGYLMQAFALLFKNAWSPLIITSLLFGLAHMNNPEVAEYGWPMMLSYYVLFALFMGAITLLDEGMEMAIGIHFANNLVASVLVCSEHSVIKTYSIFSEKSGNPTFEMITWLVFAAIVFFILQKKFEWKNFNLIIK